MDARENGHGHQRLISSQIIGEFPQELPSETVKYVEVPVIEEVVRHVPRKEYVEVETRVPKYHYETIEKIVEVPQIQTINKQVEVPQIRETIRRVPKKQIIEVPTEVIKYVPRIETRVVEKEVEVPGEIIEIPVPYRVENRIVVPRYVDQKVETVVSERVVPHVNESEKDQMPVKLREYDPYIVPVDVYIPRPVERPITPVGRSEEEHEIRVSSSQYNSLLQNFNPGLTPKDTSDLLQKDLHNIQGPGPSSSYHKEHHSMQTSQGGTSSYHAKEIHTLQNGNYHTNKEHHSMQASPGPGPSYHTKEHSMQASPGPAYHTSISVSPQMRSLPDGYPVSPQMRGGFPEGYQK